MEEAMLGIFLREKIRNEDIRRISKLKRQRAGHIARRAGNRWGRKVLKWRSLTERSSSGRPVTGWTNDLVKVADHRSSQLA
ncbi:hypothetical protein EVAR_44878_1 [Eumeta japonica]|uniref:Uncharacterized protein n=1 Tax=Eumeta variegata TaxID=151549 RepID=A0A4C1Y9F1_EUMVA|nr:hypothetical protein EVAR_44878_1 [Eumeta japonica]